MLYSGTRDQNNPKRNMLYSGTRDHPKRNMTVIVPPSNITDGTCGCKYSFVQLSTKENSCMDTQKL